MISMCTHTPTWLRLQVCGISGFTASGKTGSTSPAHPPAFSILPSSAAEAVRWEGGSIPGFAADPLAALPGWNLPGSCHRYYTGECPHGDMPRPGYCMGRCRTTFGCRLTPSLAYLAAHLLSLARISGGGRHLPC